MSSQPSPNENRPLDWYRSARLQPHFLADPAQEQVISELDKLWQQLVDFKNKRNRPLGRSLLSPEVPQGLYLWGGVGRGKTMLMDAFYECLPYKRKRRLHFHHFMAEIHREMKQFAASGDALMTVAQHVADSTRVLCLDEFHVDDIADAMILGRLIEALLNLGVVLLTTSNQAPDQLYPHGLQRQNFLPAIALLNTHLKVLHIDGGQDYRLRAFTREQMFLVADTAIAWAQHEASLEILFGKLTAGKEVLQEQLTISIQGRNIPVRRVGPNVVWFEFQELCGGLHAQGDYLEIARRYATVFISHIPLLDSSLSAAARRLTWLVDVLYDHNVRLVATAAAGPESLCTDAMAAGEFTRTASRLIEMQSQHYLAKPHQTQQSGL